MILAGTEIERERTNDRITIEPFTPEQVKPNSYNFRLGKTLRVYQNLPLDARRTNDFEEIEIPDDGYLLETGRLYLAHTIEVLCREHYAPTSRRAPRSPGLASSSTSLPAWATSATSATSVSGGCSSTA